MRIKAILIVIVVLLVGVIGNCESVRISDADKYFQGVKSLEQYQSADDVQSAIDFFQSIQSGYGEGSFYGIYAEAIMDIHKAQYDEAYLKLDMLNSLEFLPSAVTENVKLPSCSELMGYVNACRLQKSGDCVGASVAFQSVINIWDSPYRLLEMKKAMDTIYESAKAAYGSGDLEGAKQQFAYLGEYKDSSSYYAQIKNEIEMPEKEASYQTAIEMRDNGDYEGAMAAFQNLGDYRDSIDQYNYTMQLRDEQARFSTYQSAIEMRDSGDYDGAIAAFQSLGDYGDSIDQYNCTVQLRDEQARALTYQSAIKMRNNGDFEGAASVFQSLGDYGDSKDQYYYSLYEAQNKQANENPKQWLIGHWTMIERRKDANNDLIQFGFDIISIDENGKMEIMWGDIIEGYWDETLRTMTIFDRQVYVLDHRMLGGGNENYSGLAIKDDTVNLPETDSLVGKWIMTERRKNENNDVIHFEINIQSVDENGNVIVDWGMHPGEKAVWDSSKQSLTVFNDMVYVCQNGILAGGNRTFSGIAAKTSDTPDINTELTPESVIDDETLKRGDVNEAVKGMQVKLIENNILYDIADGSFGPKTEEAVRRVQEISGLPITGIADYETQKAIDSVRMDFYPQGDSGLLLYDLKYDVEEGVLLISYKNTGKNAITELQYEVYECDETKRHIGDFCGNSGYYTTRTVNTHGLSSGDTDYDTFILFEGYEIRYSNGESSIVTFSDRTKYAKVVLKQYTTQDGTTHDGSIVLYCTVT